MFNDLRKKWTRLGVGFTESFSEQGLIDLEKTILETTHAGREDSRLLFGMRGWLLKHHDLINGSRLIRFVKKEPETAVLGALIDSMIEEAPRSTLLYVRRYCKKLRKPEFLFSKIAESKALSELNREENLSVWRHWNLISREMGEMEGAIYEKKYVLKHNLNLALRALFGPGMRAEVLSYFLKNKEGNAAQIAKALEQSYQPVYSELKAIQAIGLVHEEKEGIACVFQIEKNIIPMLLKPLFI